MSTDFRALCAELIEDVRYLIDCVDHDCCDPVALMECREHLSQTRTALAQPEPEGLPPGFVDAEHTGRDREMLEAFYKACRSEGGTADEICLRGLKAALTRYARPTSEPVRVAERLPGPEDCNADGEVWVEEPAFDYPLHESGDYDIEPGKWVLRPIAPFDKRNNRRWLPHHALPVPGAEVG